MIRLRVHVVCVAIALLAGLAAFARAHEFWLEPSTLLAKADDPIKVGLRLFDAGTIEPVPRKNEKIARFVAIDADGERTLEGKDGDDPAGTFRARGDGVTVVAYRSEQSRITLEPAKFREYLTEIGADHVLKERTERKEDDKPAREVYSRSVKALVRVGDASAGFDRVVGLTLELVPETDPYALAADAAFVARLMRGGKPVADQQVAAEALDEKKSSLVTRTDADGRARFTLDATGRWMIHATTIARAPADADAEWESVWASLTFAIPAPVSPKKDDAKRDG